MHRTLPVPAALLCWLAAPALAASEPAADARPVVSIELLVAGGARPAWSPENWLAYDRAAQDDGLYDVYLRNLDAGGERCLTCGPYELKRTHNFRAAWHPTGDFLVFQVQENARRLKISAADLVTPDRAVHTELYLMRSDSKDFWQLTRSGELGSAVLDPRFSWEGDQLLWSQRTTTRVGRFGAWEIHTARLKIGRGTAQLTGVRSYEPGEQPALLLPQEFTPDERAVLITANLESGQAETGLDVYQLDLRTRALERLTHTKSHIDEYAHVSPQGRHIVWSSNSELFPRPPTRVLRPDQLRDLWIMARDGSEKRRLTFFNEPGADESLGEAYVGDFTWNPRGDQIAVHVLWPDQLDGIQEGVYLIQLADAFRR